jgi:hypothetical protein
MSLYRGQEQRFNLPPPAAWEDAEPDSITAQPIVIQGCEVGVVLRNVLSQAECQHFIEAGERLGLLDVNVDVKYRNMFRVATWGPQVADVVFNRIRRWIDEPIIVSESTSTVHQDCLGKTHGRWEPQSLNPAWRVCKYNAGGHFAPHYDGDHFVSSSEKSLQTCMLYLNGGFLGGGTNFLKPQTAARQDSQGRMCAPEDSILLRVQPEAGMCIIFHHRVWHEGSALLESDCPKYMMRTEIMYTNVEPTGPGRSAEDDEALRLVRQAEDLEGTDPTAAMECWRRAFKLSRRVREHYNG